MNYKSNSIEYKSCIKCKVAINKPNKEYCNNCKYNLSSTKPIAASNYRKFTTKFYSNNIKSYINEYSGYESGIVSNINNTKIQRNLTFVDSINTRKIGKFSFCLEFNNIDDLSSFILNSKQVNLSYLSHIGAKKLQSNTKIQKLIENSEESPSYKVYNSKPLTLPYTSPLQLLTKSSFWDNLLKVYFQNPYDKTPIYSIAHFDPKTTPQSLMSAIYYVGYKSQPYQPEELTLYMEKYAKTNLKLLIRQCSLSAIRALLIYYIVYYREGNIPLHFTCRAHATRIGYALGIHLDNKIFSELERYTRRLILIKLRGINIIGSSSHNLITNFLTEFGSLHIKPIEPDCQISNKTSVIYYEDENEGLLHIVCCTHYINFFDELKCRVYKSLYNKVRESRYKSEWNKTRKDLTRIYQKYIRIFQSLHPTYIKYTEIISKYEFKICVYYHDAIIDMYSELINKIEDLNPSDIYRAVTHLNWMLKFVLSNNQPIFQVQSLIILLGYQYLSFYKICNQSTRQIIQAKLVQVVQILSNYCIPSNTLSFIILKNGYKSIAVDSIS